MAYLMLWLMITTFICACVALVAWFKFFTQGGETRMITYQLFGGLAYCLLGFSELLVRAAFEGAAAVYMPVLAICFLVLGVWMVKRGAHLRKERSSDR